MAIQSSPPSSEAFDLKILIWMIRGFHVDASLSGAPGRPNSTAMVGLATIAVMSRRHRARPLTGLVAFYHPSPWWRLQQNPLWKRELQQLPGR